MTAQQSYVIAPQDGIEITVDEWGDVRLAQGDAVIHVGANNVSTLIDILYELAGGQPPPDYAGVWRDSDAPPSEIEAPPTVPAKPPMSNAERQRRYRESKRNGTVTPPRNGKRNTVTQDASELFAAMTDSEGDT